MNHPKPEEWVPYVSGETPRAERSKLNAHLRECVQCREEIQAWKRSLTRLDAWKLPRSRSSPIVLAPFLKWAAAAVFVLLAGVFIGRATAPKIDAENLRQTIAGDVRRDLSQQLSVLVHEEVVKNASLTVASGHRYTDQVAQELYVALKKDVDTLALNADAGLRHTEQQLVQLADYKEPQNSPTADQ